MLLLTALHAFELALFLAFLVVLLGLLTLILLGLFVLTAVVCVVAMGARHKFAAFAAREKLAECQIVAGSETRACRLLLSLLLSLFLGFRRAFGLCLGFGLWLDFGRSLFGGGLYLFCHGLGLVFSRFLGLGRLFFGRSRVFFGLNLLGAAATFALGGIVGLCGSLGRSLCGYRPGHAFGDGFGSLGGCGLAVGGRAFFFLAASLFGGLCGLAVGYLAHSCGSARGGLMIEDLIA